MRKVPDLLSWVQCFGTYMAIVASKQPEWLQQLLAYQTLIVREAQRCGGRGWLVYDSYFRQQVVGNKHADWSRLNQSLYAITFIAQGERHRGRSCIICLESDHVEEQCALYIPSHKSVPGKWSAGERGTFNMREPGRRKGQYVWHASPGIKVNAGSRHVSTATPVCGVLASIGLPSIHTPAC